MRASDADRETSLVGGRYRLEDSLGQGSVSSVWQVVDEASGQRLALKQLRADATPGQQASFEREYYTLASLKHPAIVSVYDYGVTARGPFYTMERLAGSDLSSKAPLPWRRVCACMREVASAVALLHARQLLHRDLSPKNLWLSPDGHIKLIDFGGLTPFGVADEVAGTAPFVPPEALLGQPLDQRADLYALGALGYWLLTGKHAYPVADLTGLTRAWQTLPENLSRRVTALGRPDLSPVPTKLDALIEELLSQSALGRPAAAATVIDRLNGIAEFESSQEHLARVAQGYLDSKSFVGRSAALTILPELFNQAQAGRNPCLLAESSPGMGRTRLLEEYAVRGRLMGATVVDASADRHGTGYDVAEQLSFRLLEAMPREASRAALPFLPQLAALSARIAGFLADHGHPECRDAQHRDVARLVLLHALKRWFVELSRHRVLLIVVDDIHLADEASTAWLASLMDGSELSRAGEPGRVEAPARIALLASRSSAGRSSTNPGLERLIRGAETIAIGPLSPRQTYDLLLSQFGDVPHLDRLAESCFRVCHGNPAHCGELATHLVRHGLARYRDGTWALPKEFPRTTFQVSRQAGLLERLASVGPEARDLAQLLSIQSGPIRVEASYALARLDRAETEEALEVLVREGILRTTREGHRFCHEVDREQLERELGEGERARRAHRRLGESMLARGSITVGERLNAGVHLLRGGALEQGGAVVVSASLERVAPAAYVDSVPALEQALALFRAQGRSLHEQVAPLAQLALAGYYVDPRLAQRYGDDALRTLWKVLRLDKVQPLRRWLSPKLALLLALSWAACGFLVRKRNPLVPSLKQALELLFGTAASLTGAYAVCIDPVSATRCAESLAPFAALGLDHVGGFVHAYCHGFAMSVQERLGQALELWQDLIRRLPCEPPVRGMASAMREPLLAGALYSCGVLYALRESPEALQLADELDRFGDGLYAMSADQIRMVYYANQGRAALADEYRRRVEVHAIERGTAWQVETWAPGASIALYLRTDDGAGMKRASDEIRVLARRIPSFHLLWRRAEGVSLLLRGRSAQAVSVLEACLEETPRQVVGWARSHGALARALNELGEHERARDICLRALQTMPAQDLAFPAMHLGLQIESALAEAALGNFEQAELELERLREAHRPLEGPLTLGALEEALARVALLRNDRAAFEQHLRRMQTWYLPTAVPALMQRCRRLARSLDEHTSGGFEVSGMSPLAFGVPHRGRGYSSS